MKQIKIDVYDFYILYLYHFSNFDIKIPTNNKQKTQKSLFLDTILSYIYIFLYRFLYSQKHKKQTLTKNRIMTTSPQSPLKFSKIYKK
jgi:hypothetical protein